MTHQPQQQMTGNSAVATADPHARTIFVPSLNRRNSHDRNILQRKSTKFQNLLYSRNLQERIFGDIAVAVGVTFGVAPFMCVVDKAIVQKAAGTQNSILKSAMQSVSSMARNPLAFVKSPTFLMMWGVYAATYATANSLKTVAEHLHHEELVQSNNKQHKQNSSFGRMGVFCGTTLVNSAASLWKDRAYARMYGTSGVASMPLITYGLWATRDCLVVGSSFILPDMVSKTLQEETDMDPTTAKRFSQVACPIATQFVVGPIQVLGLDFYNRPLADKTRMAALRDRTRFILTGFSSVVTARIARIAPAYAVGGVFNTQYRDAWRQHLIQKEIQRIQSGRTLSKRKSVSNLVSLVAGAEYSKKN